MKGIIWCHWWRNFIAVHNSIVLFQCHVALCLASWGHGPLAAPLIRPWFQHNFWSAGNNPNPVCQHLSKLIHAYRNYSLPKLARFWDRVEAFCDAQICQISCQISKLRSGTLPEISRIYPFPRPLVEWDCQPPESPSCITSLSTGCITCLECRRPLRRGRYTGDWWSGKAGA